MWRTRVGLSVLVGMAALTGVSFAGGGAAQAVRTTQVGLPMCGPSTHVGPGKKLPRIIPVGKAPVWLTVSERTGHVFVLTADYDNATGIATCQQSVTMLDARTGAWLGTAPLEVSPRAHFVFMSVDDRHGRLLVGLTGIPRFTSNAREPATVSILDTKSGQVLHTINLDHDPTAVTVDTRTGRAFVVTSLGPEEYPRTPSDAPALSMLDATSGTILMMRRLSLAVAMSSPDEGCCPLGLDEPTHQVFVGVGDCECGPTSHAAGVLVFDSRSGRQLKRIALREGPRSNLVSPSAFVVDQRTRRVFVASHVDAPRAYAPVCDPYAVRMLDADTDRVLQPINLGCFPDDKGIVLDSRAHRVLLVHYEHGGMSAEVLDSRDGHLIQSLNTPNFLPSSVSDSFVAAVDERTGYIWLISSYTYPNGSKATIVVLDPRRGTLVRRFPLRDLPSGAVVAQRARRVFMTNYETGTVTVLCADRKC